MKVSDLIVAQSETIRRQRTDMVARQGRIIRAAIAQTERDLLRMRSPGAWTRSTHNATMAMLMRSYRQVTRRQIHTMSEDLLGVGFASMKDAEKYLSALDLKYGGAVRPLEFSALDWIEGANGRVGKVRLREFRRSFARYGAASVAAIEDEIAVSILRGETWDRAVPRVAKAMRHVSRDKAWMIRRTVNTESSAAYNGIALEAMMAEDTSDDPMFKKLVATFDMVTGKDSYLLHGQMRPLDKPFYDAMRGHHFMAPPNRPNDRENIVAWRRSYGSPEKFDEETRVWTDPTEAEPDDFRSPAVEGVRPLPSSPRGRARAALRPSTPAQEKTRSRRLSAWSAGLAAEIRSVEHQYRAVARRRDVAVGSARWLSQSARAKALHDRLRALRVRRDELLAARQALARRGKKKLARVKVGPADLTPGDLLMRSGGRRIGVVSIDRMARGVAVTLQDGQRIRFPRAAALTVLR